MTTAPPATPPALPGQEAPSSSGGTLGLVPASAIYIAAVLGTGMLFLPTLAIAAAGPASIAAMAAVLVLSIPLAGTFAALASRFPDAGGVASFVRRALGATAARMAGYWFFFGVIIGSPVVGLLAGEYLVALVGGERWLVVPVAALMLIPPFVPNLFGVTVSARVQLILTGALVAIVVLVLVLAAPAAKPSNFEPFLLNGWGGVGAAISLLVWAFAGWEAVTHVAAEFKNPRRTIPLATIIALVVVGVAYLALQVVTVAVLGSSDAPSTVPMLDMVALAAPGAAPWIVTLVAVVVSLGVLNMYFGAFAKLGAALARDGDLPRWFAPGAEAGGIPRRSLILVAILVYGYLTAIVLNDLDLTPFILINTSCMVAVYALGMIAAVRLLERWSAGWWLAVVSVVLVGGLLLLAGPHLLIPLLLAAAAGIVTVVRRRTLRPKPR
ncbi:MAG: APC family permease [Microbacteriaceae bacterium]